MRDTSALPMVYARFGCVDIGLIPARRFKQHLRCRGPRNPRRCLGRRCGPNLRRRSFPATMGGDRDPPPPQWSSGIPSAVRTRQSLSGGRTMHAKNVSTFAPTLGSISRSVRGLGPRFRLAVTLPGLVVAFGCE